MADYTNPLAKTITENPDILESAGINTPQRTAAFLGQIGHESGFQPVDERLSQYASSQSRLHGRGFIQLTGEANYGAYGDKLGLDLLNNPDLAKDPVNALKIAAQYWTDNNLNAKADVGDYHGISTAIGGRGYHGREGREAMLSKVSKLVSQGMSPADIAEKLGGAGKTSDPLTTPVSGAEYVANRTEGAKAPPPPISTWEYVSSTWANATKGTIDGQRQLTADTILQGLQKALPDKTPDAVSGEFYDELRRVATSLPITKSEAPKPIADAYMAASSSIEEMGRAYAAVQASNPGANLPDFNTFKEEAANKLKDIDTKQAEIDSRTSWGQWMLGFGPKMAAMVTSAPELFSFTATAPIGGAAAVASKVAQPIVKAAIAGSTAFAAGQAGIQPLVEEQRSELGLESGLKHGAEEIAMAGAMGAGFGVAGKAIGLAVGKAVSKIFKGEKAAHEVPEMVRPLAESIQHQVEYNSAGAGASGLAKMKVQGEKAAQDIAAGRPVSVVPDNLASMKTIAENPEYLDGFRVAMKNDIPEYYASLEGVKASAVLEHNKKATLTTEQYKAAPLPQQAIKPEVFKGLELQQKEFQVPSTQTVPTQLDDLAKIVSPDEVSVTSRLTATEALALPEGKPIPKVSETPTAAPKEATGPIKEPNPAAEVANSEISIEAPAIDHPSYEIYKLRQQRDRIEKDAEILSRWDKIMADETIPEYRRNETARRHLEERVVNKAAVEERIRNLEESNRKSAEQAIERSKAAEQTPEEIRHQQVLEELRNRPIEEPKVSKETVASLEEEGVGLGENRQVSLEEFQNEFKQRSSFLKELSDCLLR